MAKKKILMVCEAFGGGVFTYVSQLCNDMSEEFDVYLAYSLRPQTPKNYKDFLNKKVHLIEMKNVGVNGLINLKSDIAAIKELRQIEKKVKPDKVEDDLLDCVTSIQNQTHTNLEIILVDDGSPDKCGEMCDALAKDDDRIIVIHQENGGLSSARNVGMQVMKGDYITFVDSDDVLEKKFVENLLKLLHKYQAEVAVCQNSVFTKTRGVVHLHSQDCIKEKCYDFSDAIKSMLYQKEFDVAAWGKLYRLDTLKDVTFPEGLIHEDIPTTYKALLKCNKVAYTSEELYRYQIRENSIENEKFTPKKMDCIVTSQMMLDDIEKNYPEFVAAARSRYFAAQFHILAQINEDIPEKKIIINNIKKIRGKLIKDSSASIRVRGACLLSYFGFNFTVKILNKMNKHKYI